jgi:hypothetical protein
MSSTPSKLEIALSYARLGWQVLPLHDIADGICTCHKATCASAGASLSRSSGSIAIYGFSDSAKLYSAPAASPVALKDVRPGQTVITLKEDGSALTGIVSKVDPTGIYTSIGTTVPGSAAVNSAGNLVGISSGSTGVFVTADEITALLTATSTAQ